MRLHRPQDRWAGRGAAHFLLISLLLLAAGASAQNPGGTIEGIVQDASGARVPRAQVAISERQAATARRITTDTRGEFRLDNLLPGSYRVTVDTRDFAEASSDVVVQVSTVQAETARPIALTTPVDVNGTGDPEDDRAVINGRQTTLDEFRGTPYIQLDMRVARPIRINERWSLMPFVEFFNLFNRNNPGANYVTDISALPNINPTPEQLANLTELCANPACSATTPITSSKQLLVPAGGLGDFFGPGTTVGIPFAAQIGVRANF